MAMVLPAEKREAARSLRRSQTDAERILWAHLRSRRIGGVKFRRQVSIGPFVADFCCIEKRLIVELDGGHHADQRERDDARSEWLKQHGYRVIRFWNNDVANNIEGVLEAILTYL